MRKSDAEVITLRAALLLFCKALLFLEHRSQSPAPEEHNCMYFL